MSLTRLLALLVTCLTLMAGATRAAAQPGNDDFANAEVLTSTAIGTTVGATRESGEPHHNWDHSETGSIWYRWTAPATRAYILTTCGSDFDTVLSVYTGNSVDNLTLAGCGNDFPTVCPSESTAAEAYVLATAGTTYSIAVIGYRGAAGTVTLSVSSVPGNDSPLYATGIAFGGYETATGSNVGATRTATEPHHWRVGESGSIWFVYTASWTSRVRINTCGSEIDTVMSVYAGEVREETRIAHNDDSDACGLGSLQSGVEFLAHGRNNYYIAVAGYDENDIGAVVVNLTEYPRPINDDFSNALDISSIPTVIAEPAGATREPYEPSHGAGSETATLWYSYSSPIATCVTLNTCGNSTYQSAPFAVYTGNTLFSLQPVETRLLGVCTDKYMYSAPIRYFVAQPGVTYRIAVAFPFSSGPILLKRGSCDGLVFRKGDVNLDGMINVADITSIHRWLEAPSPDSPLLLGDGDANCDGQVTEEDAYYIMVYLVDPEIFYSYYGTVDCDGDPMFSELLDPAKKYESELLSRYEVAYLGTREWSRRIAHDPVVVAESIPDYVPVGLYYFAGVQLTTRGAMFTAWGVMAAFWLALGGLVAWQFRRDWLARVRG